VKPVIFVDLDSTICDTTERFRRVVLAARERGEPDDWDAYSMECANDPPMAGPVKLVQLLFPNHQIVFVSGRSEKARELTMVWLRENGLNWNDLLLRPDGSDQPNEEYKYTAMRAYLDRFSLSSPALVIDDWPPVKERLEREGWRVLIVNPCYPEKLVIPPSQTVEDPNGPR
jgi:FMN phosphatase YigB (HAD superfamily)